MRIAVLTIFYNPDDSDIRNFIQTSKSFQGRFCFINSLLNKKNIGLLKRNNIEILGNGSNIGISRAYNTVFNQCMLNKFNLCFITDQDSKFERSILERFIKNSIKQFFNDKYLAITSMNPCLNNNYKKNITDAYYDKEYVINSGSLISCRFWKKIGKYDENLFIDMVDYDFCFRIKKFGLRIIRYDDFQFKHSIGEVDKYLFNLLTYNSYNHQRHYFMIKDRLYFSRKKYLNKTPLNKLKLLIEIYLKLLKHLLLILIYERNKYLCFRATVNAMIEFSRKN